MDNIIDLMKTVVDETGIPLQFTLRVNEDGVWTAKVTEDGHTLCDRQGDKFLTFNSDDPEEAVEVLNQICA